MKDGDAWLQSSGLHCATNSSDVSICKLLFYKFIFLNFFNTAMIFHILPKMVIFGHVKTVLLYRLKRARCKTFSI